MKLYHFCPAHFLPAIRKEGLTKGMIPVFKENTAEIVPGFQWLTLNKSFDQSWEKNGSLPYRRNEYRITVKIPKKDNNLIPWLALCNHTELRPYIEPLNECGTPENWFVYQGRIRPGMFRGIDLNPDLKEVA